jgi:ABC-2 type transport system permease protein
MKRYIRIYKVLLMMNLENLIAYRANFINSMISTIVWGSLSFVSIFLLTARTDNIYGWTRNDLFLLTSVYNIIVGIFYTLFANNFERFSRLMHFGEFDNLLTKPIDPQFSVSFWFLAYTSIFRIIIGIIIAAIIIRTYTINLLSLLFFGALIILSVSVLYSIWCFISSLIIRFTNLSNIPDLLYNITGFGRYPADIYKNLSTPLFLFLAPVTLIITTPTKALISKMSYIDILFLITIAVISIISSRFFWKSSLKYYSSIG